MRDLLRAYSVHPIYHTAASIAFVQDLDQKAQALGLPTFDSGYRGGDAPFNNSIYTLQPGDWANDWHYGRRGNGIGGLEMQVLQRSLTTLTYGKKHISVILVPIYNTASLMD